MDTTIRQTFLVTMPEDDVKFFKMVAKKLGWKVGKRQKTNTGNNPLNAKSNK